jgi:hypothetical protein
MSPSTLPARITIDFRESIDPGRGWILGVGDSPSRVELLAFEASERNQMRQPQAPTAAAAAGCTCPDFCERDHDVD